MIDNYEARPTVLFLCTGNSCRSQMAEGWAKHLLYNDLDACSAGIEKHGLNQLAVKVMKESGVDSSNHKSKTVDELTIKHFGWVITVCGHAHETCPFFPGKTIHQGFEDPPKLAQNAKTEEDALVHYRRVRDEIQEFIISLPDILSTSTQRFDK